MQKYMSWRSNKIVLLIVLLLAAVSGLTSGVAGAQEDPADQYIQRLNLEPDYLVQGEQGEPSLIKSFVKMMLVLAVVLAVAVFSLRFFKKMMNLNKQSSWLQVLAYDNIGTNKGICIVKVGERAIVLGVTESNINLLTELSVEEVEAIEYSLAETGERANSSPAGRQENSYGFHSHLQNSINKIQVLNSELKKQIKGDG